MSEDDPIGTVVTRVRAQDQEQDVLTFGLELPGPYENGYGIIKEVPFTIEPSGSVKINDSLVGKVRDSLINVSVKTKILMFYFIYIGWSKIFPVRHSG